LPLELLQEYQIEYDVKHHRVRCQGHILNLAVHDFLQCTTDSNIEGDNLTLSDIRAWTKYGFRGRAHIFVVRLARSPERLQYFTKMAKRAIPRDNKTRWNSFALCYSVMLLPQVRQAINRWFIERPNDQPADEAITEEDWANLEKVKNNILTNVFLLI
jgi:hypothetical protein